MVNDVNITNNISNSDIDNAISTDSVNIKTPIEILQTNKDYIFKTFSDFPELLALYDEAQTLYGITNKYHQFIVDVHAFVKIIKSNDFNKEHFKSAFKSILLLNKSKYFNDLSLLFENYQKIKSECADLNK